MFKSIQRDEELVIPPKKKEEVLVGENIISIAKCLKNVDHRFTMHISTDKHQYKPGETVHIRGILLNEFDHTPAIKRFGEETFNFRIIGPSGDVVLGGDDVTTPGHKKSVIAIDWNVPEAQSGGTYKIQIGKQYYEEKEMEKDEKESEKAAEEEETEGEDASDDTEFEFAPGCAATMQVEDDSITRVGRQGWHGFCKLPVKNRECEKFKFRVDQGNKDTSGLFIGVVDDRIKKNEIWKSLSYNDTGRVLQTGDVLEMEVYDTQNLVKFSVNGRLKTELRTKIGAFQRPLKVGIFMHYPQTKVTLIKKQKGGFFPMATRTFDVNNYEPPKFKMNLEFERKGYSSGGKVKASLDVERSEGGRPDQCEVVATARVDGEEVFRQTYTTTTGKQDIEFTLPEDIKAGDGNLNCSVTEGITENISKTIPILLKKIDCRVYPEGGELVYGVKNGCYVQAFTLYGDPADFAGFLLEGDRPEEGGPLVHPKPLCEVRTVHEGRGSFEFTPQKGKSYEIKVLDPLGISVPVELPEIKDIGLTIRLASRSSVPFGQPIDVILAASRDLETKLGLYKKEKCVSMSESVHLKGGEERLFKLDPKDVDGVLRLTAFFVNTGFGVTLLEFPICERLIMVKPRENLQFEIETQKAVYSPGEKCEVTIRPKTSVSGKPMNSIVCVTVTDDSVIQMQEKRKRPPRLIEMVYLENEVKELKDCTAYLQQEEANKSLDHAICSDLLLGTQGWRRFVYKMVHRNKKFYELEEYKDTDKQFFFRMLNLPNPEYFERKVEMDRKLEELRKEREEIMVKRLEEKSSVVRRNTGWSGRRRKMKKGGSGGRGRGRGGGGGVLRRRSAAQAVVYDGLLSSSRKSSMREKSGKAQVTRFKKDKKKPSKTSSAKIAMKPPSRIMKEMEEEQKQQPQDSLFGKKKSKKKKQISISSSSSMRRSRRRRPRRDYYIEPVKRLPPPPPEAKIHLKVIEYAREFSHATRPGKKPDERDDFTETVFFSPYLETGYNSKTQSYETTLQFDLSDSITSFVVKIDAFTVEGGYVGSSTSYQVKSQKPFFVSPKLPLELSMADEVRIPCGIVNNLPLGSNNCSVVWDAKGTQMEFRNATWTGKIDASERKVEYFDMKVNSAYVSQGKQLVTVRGTLDDFRMEDVVTKEIGVKAYGFLTCQPFSGVIRSGESHEMEITFDPETYVPFSMETAGYVIPSSLGSLLSATNGMIREPYGCFEQVSSTMYPMIMAKQFLLSNNKPMDKNIEKYLRHGYVKLRKFEINGGGFDWYGRAPANESLSAMGLVQFIELSKVHTVDPKLIQRTQKWLISRKNGETFRRGSGRYAYGHAKPHTTNAYIVWSLSRSGGTYEEVESVVRHLRANAITIPANRMNDNYVTALLALSYFNFGKMEESSQCCQMLRDAQNKETGSFTHALDTMTRSGGRNKTLECTALSVLAMMNFTSAFSESIAKGINYIVKNNKCGSYGSTQATVLCLQAVVKYFDASSDGDGNVDLEINGVELTSIHIPKFADRQIDFPDFTRNLKTNGEKNTLVLKSQFGSTLPYSFGIWYKVSVPPQEQNDLPFTFSTKIHNQKIQEGDTTDIHVTLENKREDEDGLPMIVGIVAIPSGVTLRMEKLKELQKKEVFSYFETFGARNVVFYWRGMKPLEKIEFSFDVSASIPGKYMGDASRAYLYYDNDVKFYVKGLQCEIVTKN